MKKLIAMLLVVPFLFCSCASFGVWSPTASTQIGTFMTWADTWVGGALREAPVIIAGIEAVAGTSPKTQAAAQAVTAAVSALGVLHAVAAAGSSADVATQQANLVTAVQAVAQTVGAVQQVVKTANP